MAGETTSNTTATGQTGADPGNKTGQAAAGAGTQAATNPEGAQPGAAQQTNASASSNGQQPSPSGNGDAEDIQARIDRAVKARLAEEKDRAEKKQKEADALAAGKYQELLAERDKDLVSLQAELRSERLFNRLSELGHREGVENIRALLKLVRDEVEFDESGVPTNLDKLVKGAIKEVPGLVTAGVGQSQSQSQAAQPQGGAQGTTRVELPANNPQRGGGQVPDGPVSLYTPGLFKG